METVADLVVLVATADAGPVATSHRMLQLMLHHRKQRLRLLHSNPFFFYYPTLNSYGTHSQQS